ncbi:MAG: carbon-nitrogen family hydrolase [Thermoleophilia bacterium]|nr:carbon-nitrogen family hydrolase [Thermoleophilia bacterium]
MRIASIQLAIRDDEAKEARLERTMGLLAACKGADLVLLPEVWNTGYFAFDRYREEAEALDGPTVRAAAEQARALGAWVHVGSFVEKQGDGTFTNTSVLLDREGRTIAGYRKMHLFGFGSDETKVLTPGTEVVTVATDFGRVGLATCYDLRFPELFRRMVDQGAEFFLVCSAWPYPRLEHWLMLNRVRALENEAFLVSSNCVGVTRGKQFCGHSQVVDPWGAVVAASGDEETVVWAAVDPAMVGRVRAVFPPLRDRVLKL